MDFKGISKSALFAITRLTKAGFSAYLVGGSVRDFLMGKIPHDFDIATSATPEEMLSLFGDVTTFESGITHGTVAIHLDGENVEMTTFRSDGDYKDHRHPESVIFSKKIEDDLTRRDFTVNAMAYSESQGLIDLFGGKEDLEKKVIKCVGEPKRRFEEDALRILRALRFSSVLGFEIEKNTANEIHAQKELLSFVSRERIAEEIKKLLSGESVGKVIEEYSDVLKVLFDGINPDSQEIEKSKSLDKRLFILLLSDEFEKNVYSLHLSKKERQKLISAYKIKDSVPTDLAEMKKLISEYGKEAVEIVFSDNELFDKALLSGCIGVEDLKVRGEDVIALGVKPSLLVGQLLNSLVDEILEDKLVNEREILIKRLKEKIKFEKNIDK